MGICLERERVCVCVFLEKGTREEGKHQDFYEGIAKLVAN
jgi:hypothetical protein